MNLVIRILLILISNYYKLLLISNGKNTLEGTSFSNLYYGYFSLLVLQSISELETKIMELIMIMDFTSQEEYAKSFYCTF
jgi:hypothetical protein